MSPPEETGDKVCCHRNPFLPFAGIGPAVRTSGLLALNNFIYYLRAKTEERHLMAYPEYRDYAAWIARKGVIARSRKLLTPRAPSSGQP